MSNKIQTSKNKSSIVKNKKLQKRVVKKHDINKSRIKVFWKRDKNYITWGFALLILLVGFNFVVIGNRVNEHQAKEAAKTPRTNQSIGIMNLTWTDITMSDTMYKPNDGYKIVMVDTNILNLTTHSIWLAPTVESYITDTTGVHYGMAIAEVDVPFTAGIYDSQKVASGQLTYAIPETSDNPEWCYELASSNGGGVPICVAINQYSKNVK